MTPAHLIAFLLHVKHFIYFMRGDIRAAYLHEGKIN